MSDHIAYCKIHPGIGIARVGNSPNEFFEGPEIPHVSRTPTGGFKDAGDLAAGVPPRVKRQAARFRIFAYDASDRVVGELTNERAEILWSVHLVNSKAEGDRFAGRIGEELPIGERRERQFWRNTGIEDRSSLVIDPGSRTVSGAKQKAEFTGGMFRGIPVPLGELRTDDEGRLLVLGGFGQSGSSNPSQRISSYANNDLWYDDVSDGPVGATVTLRSGQKLKVESAWVVVAPPDFGPSIENVVTLYDVVLDTALQNGIGTLPDPRTKPSFTSDIAPLFLRLANLDWVQQGGRASGNRGAEFKDLGAMAKADAAKRAAVVALFRNPNLPPESPEAKRQATAEFVPALSGDSGDAEPGDPTRWLSVTKTQYEILTQWAAGNFNADWKGSFPTPIEEITPNGLDRAALEACAGGAFYPGIEAGWLLRNPAAYTEPYRLSSDRLKPGDLTRRMACPWQADFFECRWNWWPAQRPDELLTRPTYQRLREIDEQLAQPQSDGERTRLESEWQALWTARSSWTRGLPAESYDGDLAMVEQWAQHGFVVPTDQDGEAFSLRAEPVHLETERDRYDGLSWPEYFHILTNIEQHPDFTMKAKEIAEAFFQEADYLADPHYGFFDYTPDALDQRMKAIYDDFVLDMNEPSRMDSGRIQWPVVVRREGDKEISKNVTFEVGRFSTRAVRERLKQRAPFNLVDGAWLHRIQAAGPSDEIRANLFSIWNDEAGNGLVNQNHSNVYDTLLRSLNIYMPAITSRKFIEMDLLPAAFIQPVFQLAVGLFPDDFFPELLGMTLYLEWEATPTLTPIVRHYRLRGIDPHFYSLHVAIDNIMAGHGFLAKEAIKLYLQRAEDEGGKRRVEDAWRRIWRGYVTWATAGDLGRDLMELCLIIDHKQIDLSYPMTLLPEHVSNATTFISKLKMAAHGTGNDALASYMVGRFEPLSQKMLRDHAGEVPNQHLLGTVVDELNRLIHEEMSFYEEGRVPEASLREDTKALIAEKPEGERLVRLNRLLLRDGFADLIADIPKIDAQLFPDYRAHFQNRFVELVKKKAYAAKPLHRAIMLGEHNLAELFDTPERLVEELAKSDLIDPRHPRDSRFFDLTSFSGPMYKIFTEAELDVILDWIESLREDQPSGPTPGPTPKEWAAKVLQFIRDNAAVAATVQRHAQYSVRGRALKEWFSDPEGLMRAFAESPDWVVRGNSSASRLYAEFATGRMSFMGSTVSNMVRQWIDSGAVLPTDQDQAIAPESIVHALSNVKHHFVFSAGAAAQPTPPSIATPAAQVDVNDRRREFAAKRKLIGMGAVH
jgi:hypothetical protein